MAYTVLARKYRPQVFDEVVGQDPIAQTLKNAIESDKLAHAFLFTGTRGVGKTTMARILAKSLNCLSSDEPTTKPCCKCDSCMAVSVGEDVDVIEIDGATNNGVEQVRQLRENAIYKPARARFKIYIIDEVHMLSTGAFNALLKILEEPPPHVKFIFATTQPNKVIPTIQSRCQRFDFVNIKPKHIAEQLKFLLKQEKIKYEEELILPLARMANGSMRDALSLLDRLISTGEQPLSAKLFEEYMGLAGFDKIFQLIENIAGKNSSAVLESIDELIVTGNSELQIIDALIDCFRDLMVISSTGEQCELIILNPFQIDKIRELKQKFDIPALIYNLTALEKIKWLIKNSEKPRPLLEATILRLTLSEHFLDFQKLTLQQQGAGRQSLKKNETYNKSAPLKPVPSVPKTLSSQNTLPKLSDINGITDNWNNLTDIIADKMNANTANLLRYAAPTSLEDGALTVTLPLSAEPRLKIYQKNGRIKQIQGILNEYTTENISLKFKIENIKQAEIPAGQPRASKGDEITQDPAVREVLIGLEATITSVDENIKSEK